MPSSYRPAIDGLDNVIGYDTFNADGGLLRRFNTEDEAIDFLIERDKPFVDPRPAATEADPVNPPEAPATPAPVTGVVPAPAPSTPADTAVATSGTVD